MYTTATHYFCQYPSGSVVALCRRAMDFVLSARVVALERHCTIDCQGHLAVPG